MVQWHDEPFALWRQSEQKDKCNPDHLDALFRNIRDWNLFLMFNIIDGCTAGKERQPLNWLFEQAGRRVTTDATAADIIP